MSQFSGKCDVYDHIMMEKMYDKGSCYVSDELECFEIFKKKTKGVIHQHYKILVSEYNQDYVKEHCPGFDYIANDYVIKDKRYKNGQKRCVEYEYVYYDKSYSLKDLNKEGVYITIDIKFDTILDLIPYYPYIVTMCSSDEDSETVYISRDPWPQHEFNDSLRSGGKPVCPSLYNKALQRHYLEVCDKYFLKDLEKRTKQISLIGYKPLHNGYYEILLPEAADYMHPPKFVWADGKAHDHWGDPILSDSEPDVVLIHDTDINYWLVDDIKKNNISIQYVAKLDHKGE